MLRRIISASVFLGVLLALRPLTAADGGLDAISSDASVVIRFKNPKATIDKIADFANQVQPGVGDQVRLQSEAIGLAISNPTLAGADKSGDWVIAVFALSADAEPGVVFAIPATDIAAMKEALGSGFKFSEHGKIGVYTESEAAAEKVAARIKGQGKSVSTVIDKESTAVFDRGDISVFINVPQLVTVYKDHLAAAKQEAANLLENLPEDAPGAPGLNPKAMSGMLTKLFGAVFQGLEDTSGCTIGMTISKEAIAFEDLVRVKSNSTTDKFLQKSAPATMAGLSSLPAGSLAYFGMQGDTSDLMAFAGGFMSVFAGENKDAAAELQSTIDAVAKLKFGMIGSSFSLGNLEQGAIRTVTITEVSEPAKMRELTQRMYKVMSKIETGGVKQTYELKADAEKFGRNSADVLTMTTETADANDPSVEMVNRMMKMMYGPEGMTTRQVYLKDRVVQTMGGGKEAMSGALAATEQSGGTTKDKVMQQARGRLSDKANMIVLFDLPGTVAKAMTLVAESGALPIPLDPDVMKGVEIKPSYLGFSLTTEPQGLRAKTHIPVEQAQGVARLVQLFIALQAAGG